MANVAWGKKILAVAVLSCLCASIAVPAYAFYYVHGEENVAATSKGVIEVTCTVDETAQGGGVKTSLIIVPEGSTAAACLDESVVSSNSQNGLAAIHVHGAQGRQPEAGHAHRVRRKRHRGREHAARALRQRGVHGGVIRRAGVRTTSRAPAHLPFRLGKRPVILHKPARCSTATPQHALESRRAPFRTSSSEDYFSITPDQTFAHRAQNPDRLAHLARKNNLCTV